MIGVDEAGRGSWAGPLVVAMVRLSTGAKLPEGVRDSKKLSALQRAALLIDIRTVSDIGVGWSWPVEIDQLGLTEALRLSALRASTQLQINQENIIVDGKYNFLPPKFSNVLCIINGDSVEPLISTASIVAKEARDTYMRFISDSYRLYSFDTHVGYGTQKHREALEKFGAISGLHRLSYKPIKKFSI